ncbi:hypothetical protein JF50_15860 [Pseudoalteromonas luteoviolacea]|uniref:Uncharacterized protein n=1 Tax=Pseudoalteromonas luteoviolacea TaxID=43657 RepID=A0A0C1QL95_9GAMM|nr:hypothetical protein [Pseudoalteromonas luteoviolacea]KID55827.1 hypothetical protein JF50_15860 [Pseudoalteromonas luteoviolacea]
MNLRKLSIAAALLGSVMTAQAQTVTFQLAATNDAGEPSNPTSAPGQKAYSFDIEMAYEYGTTKKCRINYSENSCVLEGVNNGNHLVRYKWNGLFAGKMSQMIAGWMNVNLYSPANVLIPSSNVHFYMVDNKPYDGSVQIYGRTSFEAMMYGYGSLQTTQNSNNLGNHIATMERWDMQNGKKFPMLAGCMSLALLPKTTNTIKRVTYPQPTLDTGPQTTLLCVPGNDTDTYVGIDAEKLRVTNISSVKPAELSATSAK